MGRWSAADAKEHFFAVLRAATDGQPQFITRGGKPVAVLVNVEDYVEQAGRDTSFTQFLQSGATEVGLDAELPVPPRLADRQDPLHFFQGG